MTTTIYNKADIHIHTTASDGLASPEALVEYVATKTDLSVIAVTDHNTIEGGLIARSYRNHYLKELGHVEVIVGSEIESADGEILGLFLQHDVPAGLSAEETITRIHEQNGLAIAAHPFAFAMTVLGRSGMRGVGQKIQTLDLDGVETRNATPTEFFNNPFTAWFNKRRAGLATTGGSDTHYLPTVGNTYTLFPGKTAEDLRRAIINGQTRVGGHVYSPLLIFNVLYDVMIKKAPQGQTQPRFMSGV